MAKPRTFLRHRALLALALSLAALTCGLGGTWTLADVGSSPAPVDAAPVADFSGDFGVPESPELAAAPATGERATASLAGAAPITEHRVELPALGALRPQPVAMAATSTPLYLSHCAFLC